MVNNTKCILIIEILAVMHLALKTNKHCVTRQRKRPISVHQENSPVLAISAGTKIGRASAQLIKDIPRTLQIKSRSVPFHKLIAGAECIKYEFAFESSGEARGARAASEIDYFFR